MIGLPEDPWRNVRGLGRDSKTASVVLVRAPFDLVVAELASTAKRCVPDVFGKRVPAGGDGLLLFRLPGHVWTTLVTLSGRRAPHRDFADLIAQSGARVLECSSNNDDPATSFCIRERGDHEFLVFEEVPDTPVHACVGGRQFTAPDPWSMLDLLLRSEDAYWSWLYCETFFVHDPTGFLLEVDGELQFVSTLCEPDDAIRAGPGPNRPVPIEATAWLTW